MHQTTERLNLITDDFLHPEISMMLCDKGVNAPDHFEWLKLSNGAYILKSYLFDEDDYYRLGEPLIQHALTGLKIDRTFPAISTSAISKALPNFLISKTNVDFEISVEGYAYLPLIAERRLVDCMGRVLLELLSRKLITAEFINLKMRQ